jgi:hypothetical protein
LHALIPINSCRVGVEVVGTNKTNEVCELLYIRAEPVAACYLPSKLYWCFCFTIPNLLVQATCYRIAYFMMIKENLRATRADCILCKSFV